MADLKSVLDTARLRAAAARTQMERVVNERSRTMVLMALGAGLGVALIGFLGFWAWAIKDLPRVPDSASLWVMNRQPGTTFTNLDGETIGMRGAFYGRAVTYRDPELPEYVWKSFLAIEDRRFFEHRGVDRQSMMRALFANMAAGGTVQGGSTITQQLVKNLFLTPERTFQRKLQEMILAGRIENRLSKEAILDLYLNRVDLGTQAFGVDAAARRYFGKSAHELSLPEAAMIAGLPKAPTDLAPTRNLAKAKARQLVVLQAMEQAGFITAADRAAATEAPIVVVGRTTMAEGELGYVFDMAMDEARRRAGQLSPDLVLRITVDPGLQDAGVQAVRSGLGAAGRVQCPPETAEKKKKADARSKGPSRARCQPLQGALLMVDRDGAIKTLVGGSSYEASKFNRATQAVRQPGSAFKTFVYAAAIEQGLDPDTVRYDEPVEIHGWSPKNYTESFMGAVTLRTAFAQSLNTVAAEVADLACRFGVTSLPCTDEARRTRPIPPSIALGSMEVTLLDMTQSVATFMRDGQRLDAYLVERAENSRGDVLYQRPAVNPMQVYDEANAHTMNGMLGRVVQNGTGTAARLGDREVAGKTGTSQEYRDAWFVGFTADYATGVWVGYDDFRPMSRVTGGTIPAEIFADYMRVASRNSERRQIPGVEPPVSSPRRDELKSFYRGLAEAFGKVLGDSSEKSELLQ